MTHRVNENEGSEMSVWHPMALEPDCNHIAITGLETEWSWHLDVSEKTKDTEERKVILFMPYFVRVSNLSFFSRSPTSPLMEWRDFCPQTSVFYVLNYFTHFILGPRLFPHFTANLPLFTKLVWICFLPASWSHFANWFWLKDQAQERAEAELRSTEKARCGQGLTS